MHAIERGEPLAFKCAVASDSEERVGGDEHVAVLTDASNAPQFVRELLTVALATEPDDLEYTEIIRFAERDRRRCDTKVDLDHHRIIPSS
jgi:hypothetical protein